MFTLLQSAIQEVESLMIEWKLKKICHGSPAETLRKLKEELTNELLGACVELGALLMC